MDPDADSGCTGGGGGDLPTVDELEEVAVENDAGAAARLGNVWIDFVAINRDV